MNDVEPASEVMSGLCETNGSKRFGFRAVSLKIYGPQTSSSFIEYALAVCRRHFAVPKFSVLLYFRLMTDMQT